MYGDIIMPQDQRANAAMTWAMVGRVKSGFIDMWLVDKNKGDNQVGISLWLVTSFMVSMSWLQQTLHSANC